jgi:aryl-alcohol dehydrogenase-like predicted oxidoreductase
MDYTILGRTGLKVSVAGLGCGGPSRLGLRQKKSEKEAVALVRQAIDLGVNFFDTAEWYGTEHIVGAAIAETPRDRLVISTKKTLPPVDHPDPGAEVSKSVEESLKRLRTDYIDIYHVHGVYPGEYPYVKERLLPSFRQMRQQGKIRSLGITERFPADPTHQIILQALQDDCWDVIMTGFNLLNPCARKNVFRLTQKQRVGVLNMYAVRRGLSQPALLKSICADLVKKGVTAAESLNAEDPLDFVIQDGGAATVSEAAYRFCRHEPGVHVVLTGTGNPDHLKANVEAIMKPALSEPVLRRLADIFGNVDWISGN